MGTRGQSDGKNSFNRNLLQSYSRLGNNNRPRVEPLSCTAPSYSETQLQASGGSVGGSEGLSVANSDGRQSYFRAQTPGISQSMDSFSADPMIGSQLQQIREREDKEITDGNIAMISNRLGELKDVIEQLINNNANSILTSTNDAKIRVFELQKMLLSSHDDYIDVINNLCTLDNYVTKLGDVGSKSMVDVEALVQNMKELCVERNNKELDWVKVKRNLDKRLNGITSTMDAIIGNSEKCVTEDYLMGEISGFMDALEKGKVDNNRYIKHMLDDLTEQVKQFRNNVIVEVQESMLVALQECEESIVDKVDCIIENIDDSSICCKTNDVGVQTSLPFACSNCEKSLSNTSSCHLKLSDVIGRSVVPSTSTCDFTGTFSAPTKTPITLPSLFQEANSSREQSEHAEQAEHPMFGNSSSSERIPLVVVQPFNTSTPISSGINTEINVSRSGEYWLRSDDDRNVTEISNVDQVDDINENNVDEQEYDREGNNLLKEIVYANEGEHFQENNILELGDYSSHRVYARDNEAEADVNVHGRMSRDFLQEHLLKTENMKIRNVCGDSRKQLKGSGDNAFIWKETREMSRDGVNRRVILPTRGVSIGTQLLRDRQFIDRNVTLSSTWQSEVSGRNLDNWVSALESSDARFCGHVGRYKQVPAVGHSNRVSAVGYPKRVSAVGHSNRVSAVGYPKRVSAVGHSKGYSFAEMVLDSESE